MCVFEGGCGRGEMGWGLGKEKRVGLGNRGGVGVVGVHAEDGSLRLEPGVMTSSSSVLPRALHSLLKENGHFLN